MEICTGLQDRAEQTETAQFLRSLRAGHTPCATVFRPMWERPLTRRPLRIPTACFTVRPPPAAAVATELCTGSTWAWDRSSPSCFPPDELVRPHKSSAKDLQEQQA